MENLVVIDLNVQLGHVNLNKKILSVLDDKYKISFVSSKDYIEKIGYPESIVVKNVYFEYESKYQFVIKQILLIRYIIKNILYKGSYSKILVLGFENISFSIAWKRVSIPTFIISHNNLSRGKMSLFFFKKISQHVSHIFFEKFIKDSFKELKNKVFCIPHPINPNVENNMYTEEITNLIFCPSSSSSHVEIQRFSELLKKQSKFKLYVKSDTLNSSTNIIVKKYFNNYEKLLATSSFIFIPFKYDYRVSGVFYDAMVLKKNILTTETSGKFMKEMSRKYPNIVYIVKSFNELDNIKSDIDMRENEFNSFIEEHSNANLKLHLERILDHD